MKMQVFALSVGLTWLLIPQVTMAQSRALQMKTQRRLQSGFSRPLSCTARAATRRAGRISESLPNQSVLRVLYNIAQTQYALHDFVSAHRSLVQYMAEGRGEIPPIVVPRSTKCWQSSRKGSRVADFDECDGADIRVDGQRGDIAPFRARPVNVEPRRSSAFKIGAPEAVRT